MKTKLLLAVLLLSPAYAAFSATEEQCQTAVTSTLEELEAKSEAAGKEIKLKDLSALDIMNIAKSKGSCATLDEINLRKK